MEEKKLKEILDKHIAWLRNEVGGERADLFRADLFRADLSGANLYGADLFRADLFRADLSGADLSGADLCRADLSGANLSGANLYGADLFRADLSGANLCRADLSGANLSGANLYGADLCRADLSGANLYGANLCRADLCRANSIEKAKNLFYPICCPEKGEYTAFKKAGGYIVELKIPEDALRSSATSRKCRASKAFVVSITTFEGEEGKTEVKSDYDQNFIYRVGEEVSVDIFDTNRWNECAPGIHHYITREEAVRH